MKDVDEMSDIVIEDHGEVAVIRLNSGAFWRLRWPSWPKMHRLRWSD